MHTFELNEDLIMKINQLITNFEISYSEDVISNNDIRGCQACKGSCRGGCESMFTSCRTGNKLVDTYSLPTQS